jgi:hypothetical protein
LHPVLQSRSNKHIRGIGFLSPWIWTWMQTKQPIFSQDQQALSTLAKPLASRWPCLGLDYAANLTVGISG